MCHSVETAYADINYTYLTNISQIFRIITFTIGRLGVPIFLFLTGALILEKQIETDGDILKFYKKNLLPLFITVEIWNILYNLFCWVRDDIFSFKVLIKNIVFFEQVDMDNMWYMIMILGVYIAIPFIAKIVKTFSLKTIILPIILTFSASILVPSMNVILDFFNAGPHKIILDLNFLGGVYGIYIILGYYINSNILKKFSKSFLVIMFILFFTITCLIQYLSYMYNINYNVWYNFATLFISSIFLFELFRRIKNRKVNRFIMITEYISKISLGIFFMHKIFLSLLIDNIKNINLINPLESIILFIASSLLSVISIFIFSKIKFIKEKVFLVKG